MAEHCPECGAEWRAGETCETDFHQMLAWENEYPGLGVVHHLTVLVYYLQHPSRYSPEGLAGARETLQGFVEGGLTPTAWRRRNGVMVNSRNRTWKITARPGAHGSYARPMRWTLRAPDVAAGGPERYVDNVRAWARETWERLRAG
jgi:hypothetical protein